MRVLLILPWHTTDRSYRTRLSTLLSYAPITIGSLAAIIEKARPKYQIDTVDEMSQKVDYGKDYDLVMITSITSTVNHGYEIAEKFKGKGAYVCMGGYHVKYNPDEALLHADTVFIGPGEYTIPRFLDDLENGCPQKRYEEECVLGRDILAPDRSKISLKNYVRFPAVIANPGCPNRCSFCTISDMWQDATARPVENVIDEIRALKKKIIIFFDPNFFGNRDYSIKLMKALIPLKIRWAGSATIDVGFDEELLELAQESGCNGLLFGLESLNQTALKKAGKGFNRTERYKEAIGNIKNHGIMVNGCFVLGMDGDTEEDLINLPDQVNELGLNLARFAILTPVPGTKLYRKMDEEGRIIDKRWEDYTQHKAVFMPDGMSPERLEEIYRYVWKETYSFKNILKRVKNITSKGLTAKLIGFSTNLGFKYLGIE
ncbi:MAG: B12-binding domain-containing radical SAM protein [Lachnospiraceae bacterium]|nr:B12-binding domain-containing radical SAM protein [Lachnospiraceae bacterium]